MNHGESEDRGTPAHTGEYRPRASNDSQRPLIPQASDESYGTNIGSPPKGKLGFYGGFALIVGLQVGSGIFSSPSQIDNHTPSPGVAICIWLAAGFLTWTGAMSFAELGTAIPVNGGMQEYLGRIYNDFLSFLAVWIWILAVRPSSVAVLSIIFAQYWTNAILPPTASKGFANTVLSILALFVIVLFNSMSIDATARMSHIFLWWKLATVALLVICCLVAVVFDGGQTSNQDWKHNWFEIRQTPQNQVTWSGLGVWDYMGELTTSFYAGLWAYSGWDNANMVVGEMETPEKHLPRSIRFAVPTVVACFAIANFVYYMVVPWNQVGETNTIAVMVGQRTLGSSGGIVFAVLVSVACLGSINANVFTTSRLVTAAAESGYLPRALADIGLGTRSGIEAGSGVRWATPIKAMVFNASVTVVYILVGTFGGLVTFIEIAEYLFFFLTVFGVIVLRRKEPALYRPYRVPLWMPVVFCIISGLLVVRGVLTAPIQGTVLGLLMALGFVWTIVKDSTNGFARWSRESG